MATNFPKNEWHYIDQENRQWVGPVALEELDRLHSEGVIEDFTSVISTQMAQHDGPMGSGIPYSLITRIDVEFSPQVQDFYNERENCLTTVLSGPNKSGKTLLLKNIFWLAGQGAYLIACNRYSHIAQLNTRQRDEHERRRYYEQFAHNFHTNQQNNDQNDLNLEQIITGLKNHQRNKLFSICKDLLGNGFSLQRTDPDNDFSPFYVDMDGENLSHGSSGTRLLLTLLGTCIDEYFTTILIDEPELGLSPKIQSVLARFLYDPRERQRYFPHLKQLYVVTHSHLFLDRMALSNNFVVTKSGSSVSIERVKSISDFHQLQFSMLGNDLESIFLPAAIVIVEGDSDVTFISRLLQLHIPNHKITVIRAGGDGEVQKKLNVIKEAFGDLSKSPYRARIYVLLDKVHSVLLERLANQGIPQDNIVVWSKNGIEYFYPQEIVANAFSCDPSELEKCNFESDPIEFNGIRRTKKELAQFVAENVSAQSALSEELQKVLDCIRVACS